MCGIAGFATGPVGYRVPQEVARRLLSSMRMRGPDAEGQWEQAEFRALLLHRRLSIQDLTESGAQPMLSHDSRLVIVFNGEIYNKEDLRRLVPDYPWHGTSDTEVILALYEKFGEDTPHLLRGMFAFAIWDERRHGLFLARDPYGIKPLYIAEAPEGIWFASQVKSLLQVPGLDLSAEPAGHAGFFMWGSVPEPFTLYKGIRSLPSGHSLWIEKGKRLREVQFGSIADALTAPSESSSMAPLQDRLFESVRMHFLSDVPVSVFLSAGLDSSTITALSAAAFPSASINCLTLGFDLCAGTASDETREAAQIAKYYGVSHRVATIGREDFARESQHFLDSMDQPTIDGINTYFIARMARQAGYKVALSGIGGDELFAGYASFRDIPRLVNALRLFPASHRWGAVLRRWSAPLMRRITSPKYAGTIEYGGTIEGAYLLRRALFMPWELPEVMDPELAAAGLESLSNSSFDRTEMNKVQHLPLRTQVSFLESTLYMRNQLLRDADWAGMAHSVEIRTPLVDFTLLNELAPILRSVSPPSKLDMARTLLKPLPQNILLRAKTGFFVPVREWMADSLDEKPERGLRSWAKFVHHYQWDRHGAQAHA